MVLFGPPNIDKLKAKREIKGLIKALGYKNSSKTRAQAAKALGELGDDIAVTPLIQAYYNELYFDNYDIAVCKQALYTLAKFKNKTVIEFMIMCIPFMDNALVNIAEQTILKSNAHLQAHACKYSMDVVRLKDTTASVTSALFGLLTRIGEPAIETLIDTLIHAPKTHEYFDLIDRAEEALVKIGKPAVEPLINALKDEQRGISYYAALILARIGDKRAIQPLIQMLKSKDEHIRIGAAKALAMLGDKDAVEPLIACMKDKKDSFYIEIITESLMKISKERAIEPLIELLDGKDIYAWQTAVQFLKKLGWQPKINIHRAKFAVASKQWNKVVNLGEAAVQTLVDRLGVFDKDNSDMEYKIQVKVIKALADIGAENAIKPLIDLIEGSGWKADEADEEALKALIKINARKAVNCILKKIESDKIEIRGDEYLIRLIERAMNESLHDIDDEDLLNLKNLSDFVISVETGEYVGPHDDQRPVYRYEEISCHQIRELASKELERRSKK